MMLLKNNEPNVKHFGLPGPVAKAITVYPGINEVDDAWWKSVEESKAIKAMVRRGALVAIPVDPKKGAEITVDIVRETWLKDLLAAWRGRTRDPAVLAAIEEQLAVITKKDGE